MKRLIAIALLVAACGSKKPESATANTTSSSTSVATVLELGELKLIDVSKNKAVLVHASGEVEVPDMPVKMKITTDGQLIRSDTGEVGLQLLPDGTVKEGKDGTAVAGVMLAADGTLTVNDKTLTLDAGGMLVGGNPDAPPLKVEGATTPGLKRTAMFVTLALTMPGRKHEASAPAPTGP